jgi:hypothetical protein
VRLEWEKWDRWARAIPHPTFVAISSDIGYCQIPPDLVVKSQAIDIIGLILSLIRRKTSSTTSHRPRKSSFELLSLSEGHWFTT